MSEAEVKALQQLVDQAVKLDVIAEGETSDDADLGIEHLARRQQRDNGLHQQSAR